MSTSPRSKHALLRQLAPNAQRWADAPPFEPSNGSLASTQRRLRSQKYIWDFEARTHLGPIQYATLCEGGMVVEFSADADGIDWYRVPRQVEWRLNLWERMAADPALRRGVELPDWDPDDFWVALGPRAEWQRRTPCRPVPGV